MGRGSWPNSLSAPARTSSNGIADPAWVRLPEPPIAAIAAGPRRASLRQVCILGRGHNITWQGPSDESYDPSTGIFTYSAADHNGLTKDAFVMVEIVDGKWKLLQQ